MFWKIAANVVSTSAIVMAIIAYNTKDMPLAAFAFTMLVATELHTANSSLSALTESVEGLRKRLAQKVSSDAVNDGQVAPSDRV